MFTLRKNHNTGKYNTNYIISERQLYFTDDDFFFSNNARNSININAVNAFYYTSMRPFYSTSMSQ